MMSDPSAPPRTGRRFRLREPFSGLSHLGGAALGVAGLVLLVSLAHGKPWHVSSFAVYGATLVLLYMASALYHLLPVGPIHLERLRIFDHVAIYLLIAGTYTPVCLVPLRGGWGWSLLGVVWGLALFGSVVEIAWRSAPRWLGLAIYLVMGWLAVIAMGPITRTLPSAAVGWLVAGGILYSIGAVVYAIERPRLWPGIFGSHDLWHIFVLGGSACHFVLMLFVVPFP
jgi:hemolysin III